jgi:DNA repair exonuclease SbcCD nuclease subunit
LDLAVAAWFPRRDLAGEWHEPPAGWHAGRKFRVAMAHGSAFSAMEGSGPDDRLPDSLLAGQDLDYLALGHFHGQGPVREVNFPAYYSGSPEMLAIDQKNAGKVLFVRLEEGPRDPRAGEQAKPRPVRTIVEPVPVGSLKHHELKVDANELLAGRDLRRELAALADPDLFLDVAIEGRIGQEAALPDWEELIAGLADNFFKLRIMDQVKYNPDLSALLQQVPTASVLAEFVRRVTDCIRTADLSEREEWEEALRLGLHYLSGSDHQP